MERGLKILLSEPLCPRNVTWGKFKGGAGSNTFSYGLANIAAFCIKNGFRNIKFIEPQIARMTREGYFRFLKENDFDVIGLTSCTATMDFTFDTIRLIKEALLNSIVVLGGIHATLLPEDTLRSCDGLDLVCIGEGELTFLEILKELKKNRKNPNFSKIKGVVYRKRKKIIVNEKKAVIDNLDILPIPAYEIFPMKEYRTPVTNANVFPTYTMLASRGCVFNCAFCNATIVHGRKVRYKSPEKIIEEMLHLKNNFGAKGIAFLDSTFTVNKEWVNQFCDLLIKNKIKISWSCLSRTDTTNEKMLKKMKKAGCWGITFGVESGNQKTLDSMKKGVTVETNTKTVRMALKLGYFVYASYIICWPEEDKKDALNTINYSKKLATHSALFYLPVPFPGTRLYELCEGDGTLNKNAKWCDYNAWNYDNPVYVNPKIGKEQMQKLYNYSYITYFTDPRVIWRNLKELKSLDAFKKYFYALRCLLKI